MSQVQDLSKISELIDRYPRSPESLIMILQEVQKEYHYLPGEALREVAKALELPLSKVYSVATFYNAFSLERRGDHTIRICKGTACHIRGAGVIQDQIETKLGIKAGQTTEDYKFTVETVACVGACAMAPVVIVDDNYHGSVKVGGVKKLLKVK